MSHANLPPDLLALPIAERVELVARIWDSIAEDAAIGLTEANRLILEQRLSAHQKDPNQGVSWETFKGQLGEGG